MSAPGPNFPISAVFKPDRRGRIFQRNEREILRAAFRSNSATQKSIVQQTGIPQQSASRLINALIGRSALTTQSRQSDGAQGNPGFLIRPNPEFAASFGVSIMSDAVSVCISGFGGRPVAVRHQAMDAMTIDAVLDALGSMQNSLLEETGISFERVLGIGIGIAGYFGDEMDRVNTPYMLEEWAKIDVCDVITKRFSLPSWIENDASAAAAGEGIAGVGQTYSDFTYFYIAAGFGGGVISDGLLMRGAHGNAGELAEILPPNIYPHPNLELLRRISAANGEPYASVSQLLERIDVASPSVEEWIFKVKDSLSLIASACAGVLDTQAIVIGGRIPDELAERLVPHIQIYAQNRRSAPRPLPDLVVSQVKGDAVAVGAATLPIRALAF